MNNELKEYNISLYDMCDKYYDYLFEISEILEQGSEINISQQEKLDKIDHVIDKFNKYTEMYVKSKVEALSKDINEWSKNNIY